MIDHLIDDLAAGFRDLCNALRAEIAERDAKICALEARLDEWRIMHERPIQVDVVAPPVTIQAPAPVQPFSKQIVSTTLICGDCERPWTWEHQRFRKHQPVRCPTCLRKRQGQKMREGAVRAALEQGV